MEETLEKELMPSYYAAIDEDGTLTLTEIGTRLNLALDELEPANTVIAMPAQAARALLNLLRTDEAKRRIHYRQWQKEGKRHVPAKNKTRRLGYLHRFIAHWLRNG